MPGDDGLTKVALAVLIILFIVFAALGFLFMTQLGSPEKPDTLIAEVESLNSDIKRVKKEIDDWEVKIVAKEKEVAAVKWEIIKEQSQADRLRLSRARFQTLQAVNERWTSTLEGTRTTVADYLERGGSVPDLGGKSEPYGYQPLAERKDSQERDNAQVISKLDSSIDEARNELTKANNRYTRRYDDKRSLRSQLETSLDQAKDELQKASQREPADLQVTVDGVVLSTDLASGQIVINIGENHGVKRGMRFEVFRVREGGRRSRKAFIDVRVVERETAVCMILDQDINLGRCPSCQYTAQLPEEALCPYSTGSGQGLHVQRLSASPKMTAIKMNENDPIVIGDFVQNPFFAPKKSLHFAVKGEPLSVQFKTEQILAAIRWHGGVVDAEVGAGTDALLAGKWAIEETRRAKELGIQVLHHYLVFDFMRN